jgi:large subunit ribosomal protein L24
MAKNCKCLQHNSIGVRIMQDTKRVKNPGKQRKKLFNAPAHIRHKLMSAPLSHELSASKGPKTLPVRRGDTILIKRGDNKGFEGKVSRVDLKAYRIYVEGLTREKVDGTNIFLPLHPSKVEIRNLNLDDKWRKDILNRKKVTEKPSKVEQSKAKSVKKVGKAPSSKTKAEVEEEKAIEAEFEEEEVPEVAKEPAIPTQVPEEIVPEKVPIPKSAKTKEAAPLKKQEAPVKKVKAIAAKKANKPKAIAKKPPVSKKTKEKEIMHKPVTKSKTSKRTQGGQ